jgi:hypothetical protein
MRIRPEHWRPVASAVAPFNCDLQLAVVDGQGVHALVFPCRRALGGWINAETDERIDVRPTHWRMFSAAPSQQNGPQH